MCRCLRHLPDLKYLIVVVAVLVYIMSNRKKSDDPNLFTKERLAKFDGTEGSPGLYIGIMGHVFDVEQGKKHYGPGCSYNFFAGRDASKSFITGDFETESDDLDDVLSLTQKDILAIFNWKKFYEKDYTSVGKLIGRFFDENGKETDYYRKVLKQIEIAELAVEVDKKLLEQFPPCNTEWNADIGSTFWCTDRSGGIERSWVGVPRKQYKPGQKDFNCVCVMDELLDNPDLKEFSNCDPKSTKCTFKEITE